jgi:hypothetical protein
VNFLKLKSVTLKPCPFCGGEGKVTTRDVPTTLGLTGFRNGTVRWYFVGCHSATCEVRPKVSGPHHDKEKLFGFWNGRT